MAEPSPGSLQGILSGTDVTLQAQLLLELAQHLAEGKAVSSAVSEVCKVRLLAARRPSAPSQAAAHEDDNCELAISRPVGPSCLATNILYSQQQWHYTCQACLQNSRPGRTTPPEIIL